MTATDTTTTAVRNGVDTTTLFATLDALKARPEIAKFRFRAHNRWIDGSHNRSTIKDFYAACAAAGLGPVSVPMRIAGSPASRVNASVRLVSSYLLHALAACVTTSLVYSAAARGVRLTSVESTLEGERDVQGAMGLSDEFRNGFERVPDDHPDRR